MKQNARTKNLIDNMLISSNHNLSQHLQQIFEAGYKQGKDDTVKQCELMLYGIRGVKEGLLCKMKSVSDDWIKV